MGNHGHAENTGFPDGDSLVLSVGGPAGIHADKTEKNGNGCFDAEVDPSKSGDNNDTATDDQSGTRNLKNTSSTKSDNETKESFLSMLYYFIEDVMPLIGKFNFTRQQTKIFGTIVYMMKLIFLAESYMARSNSTENTTPDSSNQ